MKDAKYYKDYRSVKSKVAKHLSSIQLDLSNAHDDHNKNSDPSAVSPSGDSSQHSEESLFSNLGHIQQSVSAFECDLTVHEDTVENESRVSTRLGQICPSVTDDSIFDIDAACENRCLSDFDSDSSDDTLDDSELEDDLRVWVSLFNIPINAVRDLLGKLRKFHPNLPKDPRTLLKTKINYEIESIGTGSYHHFGLENCLLEQIQLQTVLDIGDIPLVQVQLNIDGLPLFKSSSTQFWPILGRICRPFVSKPFPIGIYLGKEKPNIVNNYLQRLVNDITVMKHSGMKVPQTDRVIQVEISCVVCDTPARAYVKQNKGHSGYYGCDKCIQRGRYINHRVTFTETNSTLRTDVQFDEMEYADHHIGQSPLSRSGLGLVSQFPLDYMHLVCLGVMKRLLLLWTRGVARQGSIFISRVSDRISHLGSFLPKEFLRKGRSLHEIDRWKATEFRMFLVYTGQVALKGILSKEMYEHFRLLCVSIYCLSSPVLCRHYKDFANELLITFVRQFGHLYGEDQYVYNVHGLVHLADDVMRFGELDSYSSFPFESYLGNLKKLVRKPNYPLQQVIRRLSEKSNATRELIIPNTGIVKKRHNNGPRIREFVDHCQFEEAIFPGFVISTEKGDNCILCGEKVGLVRNILTPSEESVDRVFVVQWFRSHVVSSFYTEPLHSSDLRVFKVSQLCDDIATVRLQEVTCKCVLMPYKNNSVVVPLIHTI